MPLKLQKAVKPVPSKKVVVLQKQGAIEGYESLVDELAHLETIITPEILKALAMQKRLESELRAVADKEVAADARAVFVGTKADFAVTEKSEQRSITDVREVQKKLGDKLFYECARVNLTDIDRYLSDAEKSFITTARTGSRKGQLVAK